MSNRSKRAATLSDKDHLEDLSDEPLETLPVPQKQNREDDSSGKEDEVGYCKPPKHTRWKKGCPSPNPFGRPRKRRPGKLTQMMNELIALDGSSRKLTRREALDRIVRERAIKDGGNWLRLWEERKEKDSLRRQQEAKRSAGSNHDDEVARQLRQQTKVHDTLYTLITKHFPGVLETEHSLLEAGIVAKTEDGLRFTDYGKEISCGRTVRSHKGRSSRRPPDTAL